MHPGAEETSKRSKKLLDERVKPLWAGFASKKWGKSRHLVSKSIRDPYLLRVGSNKIELNPEMVSASQILVWFFRFHSANASLTLHIHTQRACTYLVS
jgi:hypothetical protein